MWCLARLLPLMIGEIIYDDDPYWNNFVLLLTIVDYVLAPVVSKDCIAYLRVLIDDHHQSFKALYPNCRFTPKMHYLVHYPDYMNRYAVSVNRIQLLLMLHIQVWAASALLVYAV